MLARCWSWDGGGWSALSRFRFRFPGRCLMNSVNLMNSMNLIMASLMLLIISIIYIHKYIYIAIVLLATFAIENDWWILMVGSSPYQVLAQGLPRDCHVDAHTPWGKCPLLNTSSPQHFEDSGRARISLGVTSGKPYHPAIQPSSHRFHGRF